MPQMSKIEVQFYFGAMSIAWSKSRIAQELGATPMTVNRWLNYETLPSDRYRPIITDAFETLLDELEERGPIGIKIADMLDRERPEVRDAVVLKQKDRAPLRDIIINMLRDKEHVRSYKVFDEAKKYGYNKVAVHQKAKQIGVNKKQVGFGRKAYSLWSLK